MNADLLAGLCLLIVLGACFSASVLWANLSALRRTQLAYPMDAHLWAEQVWWTKFGLSISFGCVVGALLALLTWG